MQPGFWASGNTSKQVKKQGRASFLSAIGDVNAGFVWPHDDGELFRVACCLLQLRESRTVLDTIAGRKPQVKTYQPSRSARLPGEMVLGAIAATRAASEEIQNQPAGDTHHV